MAELKTKPTKASVTSFLNAIDNDEIRKDCEAIAALMSKATKSQPNIKRLSDLHLPTLKKLIELSVKTLKERPTPTK